MIKDYVFDRLNLPRKEGGYDNPAIQFKDLKDTIFRFHRSTPEKPMWYFIKDISLVTGEDEKQKYVVIYEPLYPNNYSSFARDINDFFSTLESGRYKLMSYNELVGLAGRDSIAKQDLISEFSKIIEYQKGVERNSQDLIITVLKQLLGNLEDR